MAAHHQPAVAQGGQAPTRGRTTPALHPGVAHALMFHVKPMGLTVQEKSRLTTRSDTDRKSVV